MRYHLILLRVSIIKKTRDNKCCWRFREKKTLGHWKWKLFEPLWKIVEQPQEIKNGTTIGFSNHSSRCISKGNKTIISKRYLNSVFIVALFIIINLWKWPKCHSVQFSSVTQSCPTLCDPMNRSTPGLSVHHQLPEFTQIHLHQVSDAIQSSHPLSSPSPPAPNPSQHQSLFQWVNSLREVAKVLEFQL